MEFQNPQKVFHRTCEQLRRHCHVVLVRPEYGGNIGSAARAVANMGVMGSLRIVGSNSSLDASAWRMAKHARSRLEGALFFESLEAALQIGPQTLSLASTARVGSPHRPHPLPARTAVSRAVAKGINSEISDIAFVFGPEADGLTNEEIAVCDWIATIPSSEEYRSLNLAQAVLIFCYEFNRKLVGLPSEEPIATRSQRGRLIAHFLTFAEEVGFILPGDPYKMRPRLEEILGQLPPFVEGAKTLHGLLDQAIRSAQKGQPDWKGRYRHRMEQMEKESQ